MTRLSPVSALPAIGPRAHVPGACSRPTAGQAAPRPNPPLRAAAARASRLLPRPRLPAQPGWAPGAPRQGQARRRAPSPGTELWSRRPAWYLAPARLPASARPQGPRLRRAPAAAPPPWPGSRVPGCRGDAPLTREFRGAWSSWWVRALPVSPVVLVVGGSGRRPGEFRAPTLPSTPSGHLCISQRLLGRTEVLGCFSSPHPDGLGGLWEGGRSGAPRSVRGQVFGVGGCCVRSRWRGRGALAPAGRLLPFLCPAEGLFLSLALQAPDPAVRVQMSQVLACPGNVAGLLCRQKPLEVNTAQGPAVLMSYNSACPGSPKDTCENIPGTVLTARTGTPNPNTVEKTDTCGAFTAS